MPTIQRGHARKLPSGKWQLRYYDADGARHTGGTSRPRAPRCSTTAARSSPA